MAGDEMMDEVKDLEQDLERVASVADEIGEMASAATRGTGYSGGESQTIDYILDVSLQLTVEVGRSRMSIQDLLQLGQGSVIELEKLAGEPLDVYMNGRQVAQGEAVIVNEKFGVRITNVLSREERLERLSR